MTLPRTLSYSLMGCIASIALSSFLLLISQQTASAQASTNEFVTGEYDAVLARILRGWGGPDATGWLYWTGVMKAQNPPTQDTVTGAFLSCTEYTTIVGNPYPTSTQYVTALYDNAFGWEDSNGIAYWAGQLDYPALTRAQLANLFVNDTNFYSRGIAQYCTDNQHPGSLSTSGDDLLGDPQSITVTYPNACGWSDVSYGFVHVHAASGSVDCTARWDVTGDGSTGTASLQSGSGCSVSPSVSIQTSTHQVTLSITFTTNDYVGNNLVYSYQVSKEGASSAPETYLSTISINAPGDFTLSTPPAQTIPAGLSVNGIQETINRNNFTSAVTLSWTDSNSWPAGLAASFGQNPTTGSSSISVTASSNTPAGTYTLHFSGTGGSLVRNGSITVTVASLDWSPYAEAMLVPLDSGDVYPYFAAYVTGQNAGQISNQVTSPAVSGPNGAHWSGSSGPVTTGSTPSAVSLAGFSLPNQGFGNYTFSLTVTYSYGGQVLQSSPLQATKNYPQPSLTSLSSTSTPDGTSTASVTITGSGLGAPDTDLSVFAGVTSVNVSGSGITASFTPQSFTTGVTGTSVQATLNTANAQPGTYNVSVTVFGYTTNSLQFYITDITPVIGGIQEVTPLYPDPTQPGYISIYGTNFGPTQGSVQVCVQNSYPCTAATDVSATVTYWGQDQTQVNAMLTLSSTASGTYDVRVTSLGLLGTGFISPPGGSSQSQSNAKQVTATPLIKTVSPAQILVGNSVAMTITGSGFTGTTGISAQDMTFTGINVVTSTQITVTAALSATAQGGNTSLTVTANQRTSNGAPVKKQVPSSLVRYDYPPGAPGGIGPLQVIVNGNVVDLAFVVLMSNQCGVYRNYAFDLTDQDRASISGTYTFTEHFANYSGPVGTPATKSFSITPNSFLPDTQFFGHPAPTCLALNEYETFDQMFYVTTGGQQYDLSTTINISRGNFNGTLAVDETITTQ